MVEGRKPVEVLARLSTPFNRVSIRRVGRRIDMEVEGATFATFHPHRLLTGYSWDGLTAAALLGKTPSSVLVLGLAGGTSTRQMRHLLPRARIVAVEIDPALVGLARAHMDLDDQNIEIQVADADAWIQAEARRYDVVIDDLYRSGDEDVARTHPLWGARLSRLRKLLRPGGRLVANFITDGHHDVQRQRAQKAFEKAFAQVKSVLPPEGLNEILVGGAQLGDWQGLQSHARDFSDEGDRVLWRDIRVFPP
jgi:predicted membrane-bound spermidine synthase